MLRLVPALLLASVAYGAPRFEVRLAKQDQTAPLDGRLIVVVSKQSSGEPRFHVTWGTQSAQIFGVNVDGLTPASAVVVDASAPGDPLRTLDALPPGKYRVQAVLHRYETVRRADGHTLKVPMDDGEGQQWNRSPGNLFSKPADVEIGPSSVVQLQLTDVIPPIPPPKDTKYIRHFRMQSELLTKFWGRPMFLGAIVLTPEGFDDHPQQRYPVAYHQGHFPRTTDMLRESAPPAGLSGPQRDFAHRAHRLYQDWTSGRLPRMLIVLTQHPTPYYDDSYGVNTANMGPYGDALIHEFYPALEKHFRAIGEPWARVVYGGSTGGWMSLAQQIFYPEFFGGVWGFCPDPVDFHAFQTIDLYGESNAYYDIGPFARLPKLLGRLPNDRVLATVESFSRQEAVLGTRGRSGGQLDAFHATFGPAAPDGYPAQLWNPETGQIDTAVAAYWREHFDLTAMLQRDWERLGPKLVGKLHITMGTKDTFFLDAAVKRMETFLESTKLPGKGPYYGGSVDYGNNEPHCWIGPVPKDQHPNSYYLPIFADHMRKMAPQGADVESWR